MKRDMDLIRKIVLKIEDDSTGEMSSEEITVDGYTPDQVAYHCELIFEAGLIDAIDASHLGSKYRELIINRLTTKGHDFVDGSKDESLWKKALTAVKAATGGAAIDVLIQYMKAESLRRLGISEGS